MMPMPENIMSCSVIAFQATSMSRDGLGTSAFKRDQCLNEREFRCGWSWMMYSGLQRRETFELVATSGEFVGGTLEPHGDLLQWEPTGSPHDAVKKQQCTGLLCEQHCSVRTASSGRWPSLSGDAHGGTSVCCQSLLENLKECIEQAQNNDHDVTGKVPQ